MPLPPAIQALFARLITPAERPAPRQHRWLTPKAKTFNKKTAGLWPCDERGQYVSAKTTSKRNRKVMA